MCQLCADPNRWLLKQSDPVDEEIQTTIEEFAGVLQSWHTDIIAALGTLGIDFASEGAVQLAVERQLDPYSDRWVLVLQDAWERVAEAGRSVAIQEFDLDIDWQITDPATRDALDEHGQVAAEHTQTRMVGDVSAAITEAYDDGVGIDEIASRLQEDVFPDMRGHEARRVARTEGIGGANKGRLSGFEDAGAGGKDWMARDDSLTRQSHNQADNQTVGIDESFTVGGHDAQYPGDPSLPPEERIYCRCLVLPNFDIGA